MADALALLLLPARFKFQQLQDEVWVTTENEVICDPLYFCQNKDTVRWEVDNDSKYSLGNWYT